MKRHRTGTRKAGVSPRPLFRIPVRAVLALLALSLAGAGWASGRNQDGPSSQDTDPAITQDERDKRAVAEFVEAYRLAPGQDLKRVTPPRPPGLDIWWKQKLPNRGNKPNDFGAMVFRWSDPDRLQNWGGTTGTGYTIQSLPRFLGANIYPAEIDGDQELLQTVVTGDWIFRSGASDERLMKTLDNIIQRAIRLRITLTLRTVERDVVIARGTYRSSPLPNRSPDEIEIYAKQIVPGGGGFGGGGGKFPVFLKWVGEWIERPVVNEVENPPKRDVTWYYNGRSPSTEQTLREDHDEALVLKHLTEQTGLSFTRERKPIPILFVERAK
jgi:hypothetical protein